MAMSERTASNDARRFRYTDGTTYLVVTVPWGDGTGWIPPGHIDFQMTVTHETRRFVYDGPATARPSDPCGCSCHSGGVGAACRQNQCEACSMREAGK